MVAAVRVLSNYRIAPFRKTLPIMRYLTAVGKTQLPCLSMLRFGQMTKVCKHKVRCEDLSYGRLLQAQCMAANEAIETNVLAAKESMPQCTVRKALPHTTEEYYICCSASYWSRLDVAEIYRLRMPNCEGMERRPSITPGGCC